MSEIWAVLLVAAVAAIMGTLSRLGTRLRRRGVGGDLMNPVDEIFHPAAHRFRAEVRAYEERAAPRPAADDIPPGTVPEWRAG